MLCFALLVLAVTVPVHGIIPEIVNSDINQILEGHYYHERTALTDEFAEVEQPAEETQQKPEDAVHQMDIESTKFNQHPLDIPSSSPEQNSSESRVGNHSVDPIQTLDKGTEHVTKETQTHPPLTTIQPKEEENNINHDCILDEDCEKGRYCRYQTHSSICLPCKDLDVPCTKDEECCAGQLCVWGQCTLNATKGEPGSICQFQSDCSPDLCCAFHKALLFPVCLAKPIERERCYGPSNHLMELSSWDSDGKGPREHCPCAGDLHCQPLGRGSLCQKGQNSSEEDLTDTLYSEIDYVV
ncbi:dickkopf-related protein 3a [Aplochiton taeniatus]